MMDDDAETCSIASMATLNLSFLCTDCEMLLKENITLKDENIDLKNKINNLNKLLEKNKVIKIIDKLSNVKAIKISINFKQTEAA